MSAEAGTGGRPRSEEKKCMRVGTGVGRREERFGPRSIAGCSTNPLFGVMTAVIDVRPTNDPALKPS